LIYQGFCKYDSKRPGICSFSKIEKIEIARLLKFSKVKIPENLNVADSTLALRFVTSNFHKKANSYYY